MTLGEAAVMGAARLNHLPQARRDAELLLARCVGCDRGLLLTHPETKLAPGCLEQYQGWLDRRLANEPIQYITGEQEFFGLSLRVTREVLIPRPETEHAVEAVLERVPHGRPLRIVDVGTGSGAIAIALAHALPDAELTAVDLSPAALAIARENALRHGVAARIRYLNSDLLAAVAGESFDAVVANLPYIAEGEVLEPQVRDYEPRSALYAGPTGLEAHERLIPQACEALKPGGWLVLEIGYGQQAAIARLLGKWKEVSFAADLQGIPRVAIARR